MAEKDPEVLAGIIAALLDRETNALQPEASDSDRLFREAIEAVGGRDEAIRLARNENLKQELSYAVARVITGGRIRIGSEGEALRATMLDEIWDVLTYCGLVSDSPDQNDTPS